MPGAAASSPSPLGTEDRLRERIAHARANWPDWAGMALTDRPEAALVPASPTGLWLIDRLTARISPRAAGRALAAAIRAGGGEIIEDMPAPDARDLGYRGGGLAPLGGGGVGGRLALLAFAAPRPATGLCRRLHIVPHGDGTVAIGSTSERGVLDTGTDAQLEALIAKARAICPALADAPSDRWAGSGCVPRPARPWSGHGRDAPGIERQWRLQDRSCDGAHRGRDAGRPDPRRPGPHPPGLSSPRAMAAG